MRAWTSLFPLALGAPALAMLDTARRRVVPVAKAVGRAGPAVTGATVIGVSGIVNAVIRKVRTGPQARGWRRWSVLLLVAAPASCGGDGDDVPMPEAPMTITLRSPVFADGDTIPRAYTCDGDEVSPPLEWSGVPSGTAELAVVVEDPGAPGGTFVHWVLWGLDAGLSGLGQGDVPAAAREGRNDFGRAGWGGPCPPSGSDPHRYVFTLLALSDRLAVEAGASADGVKRAAEGKVLAEGRLTGRYGR